MEPARKMKDTISSKPKDNEERISSLEKYKRDSMALTKWIHDKVKSNEVDIKKSLDAQASINSDLLIVSEDISKLDKKIKSVMESSVQQKRASEIEGRIKTLEIEEVKTHEAIESLRKVVETRLDGHEKKLNEIKAELAEVIKEQKDQATKRDVAEATINEKLDLLLGRVFGSIINE